MKVFCVRVLLPAALAFQYQYTINDLDIDLRVQNTRNFSGQDKIRFSLENVHRWRPVPALTIVKNFGALSQLRKVLLNGRQIVQKSSHWHDKSRLNCSLQRYDAVPLGGPPHQPLP